MERAPRGKGTVGCVEAGVGEGEAPGAGEALLLAPIKGTQDTSVMPPPTPVAPSAELCAAAYVAEAVEEDIKAGLL
jgi:hypothetical protein